MLELNNKVMDKMFNNMKDFKHSTLANLSLKKLALSTYQLTTMPSTIKIKTNFGKEEPEKRLIKRGYSELVPSAFQLEAMSLVHRRSLPRESSGTFSRQSQVMILISLME